MIRDALIVGTTLVFGGFFGLMWGFLNALDRFLASRWLYVGPVPTAPLLRIAILLLNLILGLFFYSGVANLVFIAYAIFAAPPEGGSWLVDLFPFYRSPSLLAEIAAFLLAAFGSRRGVLALFHRQLRLQKS